MAGRQEPNEANTSVIVCFTAKYDASHLFKMAHSIALGQHQKLIALYIDKPQYLFKGNTNKLILENNLRQANEIGAETIIITHPDIVASIIHYAKLYNAEHIVVGKSKQNLLKKIFKTSILNRLILAAEHSQIHVVSNDTEKPSSEKKLKIPIRKKFNWLVFIVAVIIMAIMEGVQYYFYKGLTLHTLILLHLLIVIGAAYFGGTLTSLAVVVTSFLQIDYLHLSPLFNFKVSTISDFFIILVYGITALTISQLLSRIKQRYEEKNIHDIATTTLYHFTDLISHIDNISTLHVHTAQAIYNTFHLPVALLVGPTDNADFLIKIPKNIDLSESILKTAQLAWKTQTKCGIGTETFNDLNAKINPIVSHKVTLAVIIILAEESDSFFHRNQQNLFNSLIAQAGHAIHRAGLEDAKRETEILQRTDKLRTALLSSISHDLRTPLVSIMGSVSTLMEYDDKLNNQNKRELFETAYNESFRLSRFISNLIDMTKFESGTLNLNRKLAEITDIIHSAKKNVHQQMQDRKIRLDISDNLPLLYIDSVMTEHVFINILENCIKYSKSNTTIFISATVENNVLKVNIQDQGIGISAVDLPHIFDRFYRAKREDAMTSGHGLGLAICKSILEAEDADITVFSEGVNKGAIFTVAFKIPNHNSEKS